MANLEFAAILREFMTPSQGMELRGVSSGRVWTKGGFVHDLMELEEFYRLISRGDIQEQ